MPTISLPPVVPTTTCSSPPSTSGLRRTGHNNRRREPNTPSTPTSKRSRRVSSIYSSPPPISDRESSLYSHRVYASPAHDWSKSCNDLGSGGGFGASTFTLLHSPTPVNHNYPLQQDFPGSIYGNETVACLGQYNIYNNQLVAASSCTLHHPHQHHHQASQSTGLGGRAGYRSVVGLTTNWESEYTDTDNEEYQYRNTAGTTTDSTGGSGSSSPTLAGHSAAYPYYDEPPAVAGRSVHFLPLNHPGQAQRDKTEVKTKWYTRSFWRRRKSNNMSTSSTPAIPPRSALRPKASQAELFAPGSTLFTLPVGEPLAKTPSLSSGSDGEMSEDAPARSPTREEKERGIFFGKKKVAVVERDPFKVRDGRGAKESKTGVYTPPTYPGACGPRPSHFPSHVYTPTNFQLYPTPSPGPSRSASTASSSESGPDTPQTPLSPTFRTFGKTTMAGLRRISGQIASYSNSHSQSPVSPGFPSNPRDSYFSYSSTTSRQSSIGPITPQSAQSPGGAGLGVGLSEKDGVTLSSFPMPPDSSPSIKRTVVTVAEAPKGRRKPVPAAEAEVATAGHPNGVHAL